MFISIVVPIYNVESYLEECIDSLLKQTYKDYEIILVDDGSTDSSGEIADKYSKYNNVNVIHQRNAGLSSARNTGIKKSQGDYIMLVDSDDYIVSDAIEKVFDVVKKYDSPDIILGHAFSLLENGSVIPKMKRRIPITNVLTGKEFLEIAYKTNSMASCAQFSIYNKDFLNRSKVTFEIGLLHEDELWTPTVYYKAERVVDGNFYFYYHRVRNNSINHAKNKEKNAKHLFYISKKLMENLKEYDKTETIWLRDHVSMIYMSGAFAGGNKSLQANRIDRMLPLRNSKTAKNKIKSLIFLLSPKLYVFLDRRIKGYNLL